MTSTASDLSRSALVTLINDLTRATTQYKEDFGVSYIEALTTEQGGLPQSALSTAEVLQSWALSLEKV